MSTSFVSLVRGSLLDRIPASSAGVTLNTRLCEVGRAFIPKGRVGRHYRAVSRNGRVLLASDRPIEECGGRLVRLRIAGWHRRILPGDKPGLWGVLLVTRAFGKSPGENIDTEKIYDASLAREPAPGCALCIDLGGLRILNLVASM